MNKLIRLFLMAAIITTAGVGMTTAMEEKKHQMPPVYVGSAEFERLKALAGKWEGMHKMGEEEVFATVEYSVTSNGSAILEKTFPGTPHEMVSIYHDKGDKVSMIHYCALGNRPQMDLVSSDENTIALDFSKDSDFDPATQGHMHSLTIKFDNENTITQVWTMFENGEAAGSTEITLNRVVE